METKKIIMWSAAFVVATGLVFGALVLLRNRGVNEETIIPKTGNAAAPKNSGTATKRNESLTQEELKLREQNAELGKTLPADITQTWSPEYKAQMIKMTGTKQQFAQ